LDTDNRIASVGIECDMQVAQSYWLAEEKLSFGFYFYFFGIHFLLEIYFFNI